MTTPTYSIEELRQELAGRLVPLDDAHRRSARRHKAERLAGLASELYGSTDVLPSEAIAYLDDAGWALLARRAGKRTPSAETRRLVADVLREWGR